MSKEQAIETKYCKSIWVRSYDKKATHVIESLRGEITELYHVFITSRGKAIYDEKLVRTEANCLMNYLCLEFNCSKCLYTWGECLSINHNIIVGIRYLTYSKAPVICVFYDNRYVKTEHEQMIYDAILEYVKTFGTDSFIYDYARTTYPRAKVKSCNISVEEISCNSSVEEI